MRTLLLSLVVAAIVTATTGCGSVHELPDTYAPLKEIRERPSWLGKKSTITTIGQTVYVADLEDWLSDHAPGSARYDGTLRHEQVHAQRQERAGVTEWLARYGFQTDFMWAEEQRGWYEELRILRNWGYNVSPQNTAQLLSNYRNLVGRMVSYNDALIWVNQVLAGKWAPPPD